MQLLRGKLYPMNPSIYMLMFSAALVITYVVVRSGRVHASSALITGTMLNSLFFFLYSISRENPFNHALLVGATLGVVFTGLSVTLGVLFREDWANQSVAA
jgi:hypothetical protein